MMTVQYETQKKFRLEEMNALIEGLSPSDSAFGVNEGGEEIYFSSRLVERMQVNVGDEVIAHCVPNYPDQKHFVPWRCIKISK